MRSQDGGGIGREDHLLPNKGIKISSACGTVPTEHLWNVARRPQIYRKASQSPRNEVGQKIKDKKGDKEFGMGACILGTESWRRKGFCILGKPLTSKVRWGELQNLRGKHSETDAPKAKWRNFITEIARGSHACGKQGLGVEIQASGLVLSERNGGWLPWRYSEGANMTQRKQTRENPGTTSVC